jgi:hypothetical protein
VSAVLGRCTGSSRWGGLKQSTPGAFVSPAQYAAAALELYSRLWQALENLAVALAVPRPAQEIETLLTILRLELVVLLDTLNGERLRALLNPDQRRSMHTTIERLLDELSSQPGPRGESALAEAQDRLLDISLALLRAATRKRGVGFNP